MNRHGRKTEEFTLKSNRLNPIYLAIQGLLVLLISGCIVPNKELMQLKSDVQLLKQSQTRLRETDSSATSQIESRLNSVQAEIESSQKSAKRSDADTGARIDSLKADFQQLLGRFEELKYSAEKSSGDNRNFLETANDRMTAVETKLTALSAELSDMRQAIVKQREEEKKREETKVSASEIYKAGLNAINDGKPNVAREKFKLYLSEAPDGPLANNAQFWIGESYFVEGNYERAILEYDEVLKKYPDGGKVPAALLKQAMAFDKIKNPKTAQALYKKLVDTYPKSEEAAVAQKKIIPPKKKK